MTADSPIGGLDDELTELLRSIAAGNRNDVHRLMTVAYDELRSLAEAHMCRERVDHTLQPTALVHEAFLRLVNQRHLSWPDRARFFGAASEIIRRILVDHARTKGRGKRGGDWERLTMSGLPDGEHTDPVDLIALDDALNLLAQIDVRQARIVEMRFFGGLGIEAIADLLEMGKRSVDREWCVARTWLYHRLVGPPVPGTKTDEPGSGT